MNVRRTGILVSLALAGGIAIGAAGSTFAASPAPQSSTSGSLWQQMGRMMGTSGGGMMGGSAASLGAGMMGGSAARMMGSLSQADRDALLAQCDELHDAMHAAVSGSPALSRQ